MFEATERMRKQQSSSIFSSFDTPETTQMRPKKRLNRDFSDQTLAHGQPLNRNSESPYLRPSDHSVQDIFGNFPSDFYRKDIKGFYTSSQVLKPKISKLEFIDKIHNNRSHDFSQSLSYSNRNHCSTDSVEKKTNFTYKNYKKGELPKTSNETRIECIGITGLKSSDDEITLKNMCQGLHLVQIRTETDNFTGKCLGKATLQVRSSQNSADIDRFKLKLIEKGYEISTISASKGKRNNYPSSNFLDSRLQHEEKRLSSNELSSRERKRAVLATSDDWFGNSPSKFVSGKAPVPEINLKENHENIENFRKWQIVKNLTRPNTLRVQSLNSGYARPTISSRNKGIFRF